uniref:Spondin domain-containing protein n=1 Tax=Biomphalaria glabrata TaxID=6526 RepID=A0A2C9JDW0_BIOGL
MDLKILTLVFVIVALLSNSEGSKKNRRSKRNHVTCRPNSLVRYRVTVHTLWSRTIFPNMFPTYRPHAQWSALIGRTHGPDYTLWAEGHNASAGVKAFAEFGDSSQLDLVSTQGFTHVLDAFIAPPIQQSVGQTSAVVFLDGRHSRVSFIMKIVPSPDWFIGVSSVDLCANGRWKNQVRMDMHPMDGGTDQGLTFTSPNWPNVPFEPISTITSSFPDHPASSFYYPDLPELPPIAFVTMEILSEYRHKQKFSEVNLNETPFGITPQLATSTTRSSMTSGAQEVSTEQKMSQRSHTLVTETPSTVAQGEEQTKTFRLLDIDELRKQASNQESQPAENLASSQHENKAPSLESKDGHLTSSSESDQEATTTSPKVDDVAEEKQSVVGIINDQPRPEHTSHDATSHQRVDATAPADMSSPSDQTEKHQSSLKNVENIEPTESQHEPESTTLLFELIPHLNDQTKTKLRQTNRDEERIEKPKSKPALRELLIGQPRTSQASQSNKINIPRKDEMSLNYPQNDQNPIEDGPAVDCLVDHWSPWNACSVSCGFGKRERTRQVLQFPQNGGSYCPLLRHSETCGSMRTCKWNHFSSIFNSSNRTRSNLNRLQRRK